MFLDSNKKLVAVLTTAKTTLNMPVTIDAVDLTTTTTTPFPFQTYTNGTTPVDILSAPAASTIRKVNGLSIYGRDTAAKIIRVYGIDSTPTTGLITAGAFVAGNDYQIVSVGTTDFTLIGASANTVGVIFTATGVGTGTGTAATAYQHVDLQLQIDDTLCYTDAQGWYAVDSQGNLKSVQAASATSIANAITSSTEKVTPIAADKVGIVDSVTGLLNWSSFTDLLNFFASKSDTIDGWIRDTNTWTYASASSFTVSGDVTATFKKGTKLKYTQTTVKYCHVASSSFAAGSTTVNIIVNNDYTLANAAISANYFSFASNPSGFPSIFAYTSTLTGFTASTTTLYYTLTGGLCYVFLFNFAGTSNSASFIVTAPIVCTTAAGSVFQSGLGVLDNGTWSTVCGVSGIFNAGQTISIGINGSTFAANAFAGFTASGSKAVQGIISYPY